MIEHFKLEAVLNRDFNTGENNAEFRITEIYINNTNEDVCIVQRNNLPVIVKRSQSYFGGAGNLTIRTFYNFNNKEQIVTTINNIDRVVKGSQIKNIELEILHAALLEAYNSCGGSIKNYAVALDKEVPIKKIKQHAAIYIHEADLVVCDPRSMIKCLHPYSDEGMMLDQYRDFIERKKISGLFVELIDNDNKITTRYMYVAKKLVVVPTKVDKTKKSGVYFTKAGFDVMDEIEIEPEYYSFEDAEQELGLHRTAEAAQSGGDPGLLLKIEEDKIRREFLELKTKTDRERVISEERQRKLESELNESKLVRTDFYDQKKLQRGDYYEDRSHVRKDGSEIWKFASAICITALGVYAAVTKANSK